MNHHPYIRGVRNRIACALARRNGPSPGRPLSSAPPRHASSPPRSSQAWPAPKPTPPERHSYTGENTTASPPSPRGNSEYNPLPYIIALIGLFAADILTTVWFTGTGTLIETNPHLLPIAGSLLLQALYKTPFAAALITGTLLTATSCDLLRPGAGRYPWLAALAIYTIPPAHNLLTIAQAFG